MENYIIQRGFTVRTLHLDDFLDPNPFPNSKPEIHAAFDDSKVHAFFSALNQGEKLIEKPKWVKLPNGKKGKGTEIFNARGLDVLIVEGEFPIFDKETYDLKKYCDIQVTIDAADVDIIRWNWLRGRDQLRMTYATFCERAKKGLANYRSYWEPLRLKYSDIHIQKDWNHNITNYFKNRLDPALFIPQIV